ncbi:MAG: hypothetical protein ACREON_01995 [Gemmatimonadaceae bacterium]
MKLASVEKFIRLEKEIASERGGFALFGLFTREGSPHWWDLIIAAPWPESRSEAVEYVVGEIKSRLGSEEFMNLSRIVFINPADPSVQEINKIIRVEHGSAELRDYIFAEVPIEHAYIITSQSLEPSGAT